MIAAAWVLVGAASLLLLALAHCGLAGAPGGDAGIGWAFGLVAGHVALLVLLLLLLLALASAGRLPARPWANGASGLLFVLVTASVSALWALSTPTGTVDRLSLAAIARIAPLLGPAMLLLASFVLLRGPGSGPWVERLLLLAAVHAVVGALLLALPDLSRTAAAWHSLLTRSASTLDAFQQQALDRIAASDPGKDWPMLLEQFRAGQHPTLRAAARARLDELPDWQARALAGLDGPHAQAVFVWLSQESPLDPAAFAARLPSGIRREAERVRQRIRNASHPSHLYGGLMVFEVERVLSAANRLHGHGVDFAPALRDLRAAFDEPTPYVHPRYGAVDAIDRWLRAHD
jgi:hypothetical protein